MVKVADSLVEDIAVVEIAVVEGIAAEDTGQAEVVA